MWVCGRNHRVHHRPTPQGGTTNSTPGQEDLEGRLVAGLLSANERIAQHGLLQQLLSSEPDELLPTLFQSESVVNELLRQYLLVMLGRQPLRPGIDAHEAADYLARMLVLHIGSAGRWDLTNEPEVRRLVRTQFLAGILPPEA